jgi:MmyB-like transcription regulator ligand binding domain
MRHSRPFAVSERLGDLAVADPHEVHAAEGRVGGVEPPADDSAFAVHVDMLDFETDARVTDEPLPSGEALVVAGPAVAVGRGAHALHDAVVGDDVDEPFGRARPGVVARLADAMELSLRERNNLLRAAGFAPAFPESPLDDATLRPVRRALDTILDGHLPYPAMIARPHGVLVAANRAFDVFYEDVDPELLQAPVNTFRLALHPKGIAPRVGNLPEWGRHITENLRARLARTPDPALEVLLVELEGYLPPLMTAPDVLGFAVPLELESRDGHLRLITTLTSFATATDITLAELELEAFLPADEATADVLRKRGERW